MTTVSGCTLVRNAVKLRYPLEASILTYYPLCDEVVISYDPSTDDGTDAFIKDLCRRYPKIRPVPSPWNMENHEGGTEITIQSNVAVEECTGDWILYVQADEAIHEGDHDFLREVIARKELNGALFARRSFLGTLDREIPDYYARNLLRLFRNGQGCVVGDGMTCGLYPGVRPALPREQPRMFNYSRMGDREEVIVRSRCRDAFHHSTEAAIDANVASEYTQKVSPFDAAAHPEAIRRWYQEKLPAVPAQSRPPAFPVTLALLLGPGERENLAPFFWQFRQWPGDVVVLDDMTEGGEGQVAERMLRGVLGFGSDRYQILRAPLRGDFGEARNRLQKAAKSPWILMSDPDERWGENRLADISRLVSQLERDRKLICGFPRANFIDGVLVNDLPSAQWTEEGLLQAPPRSWPPRNSDVQYRLVQRSETWTGKLHERPARLATHPEQVVVLRDFWILHAKTLSRQRHQDAFYKSLGQREGMPDPPRALAPELSLREKTIRHVLRRLPAGPVVLVETGTLRDASEEARLGDGWSTVALAEGLAERGDPGSRLYSIDLNPDFIEVSKRTVPSRLHPFVTWICADAAQALRELPEKTIDLLYLDSSDDPEEILAEFEEAESRLAPHSIVVVDDTGPYHAGPFGKGTRVIPEAEGRGWKVERIDDARYHMTVLSRPPEDARLRRAPLGLRAL